MKTNTLSKRSNKNELKTVQKRHKKMNDGRGVKNKKETEEESSDIENKKQEQAKKKKEYDDTEHPHKYIPPESDPKKDQENERAGNAEQITNKDEKITNLGKEKVKYR